MRSSLRLAFCLLLLTMLFATPVRAQTMGFPFAEAAPNSSGTEVDLAWIALPSAVLYGVYRSTVSGQQGSVIYSGTGYTTSFADTGLTTGTVYYYTVIAGLSGGVTEQSTQVSAKTGGALLAPPASFSGMSAGTSGVLTWQAVPGATSYDIFKHPSAGTSGFYAQVPSGTNTFTDHALSSGVTYTYSVAAVNANGQGLLSPSVTVTQQVYMSNLTVSAASVIGGSPSTGTVTLSEVAPSGGAVIPLLSANSAAIVPASLTIPAGSRSGTFTINTSSVAATMPIVISGTYLGLTQAATLYVQPAGTSLAIQNLGATAGNACAVLSWTELPEGSVSGYNVYRLSNGTPVKLTRVPQSFAMYADRTARLTSTRCRRSIRRVANPLCRLLPASLHQHRWQPLAGSRLHLQHPTT